MKWIVYLREVSLTVACITAIVTHAMGSVTISPLSAKVGPVQHGTLGVGAGVVTILSLPMILLYDMAQERSYAATVLFELVWMLGLGILWIVVGVQTMGYSNSFFSDCQGTAETAATAAASLAVSNLCGETHTMVIFAFITAVTLLLYAVALGGLGFVAASSSKPIWTDFKIPAPPRKK
ncbi:hypothetical protein C8Q74DRAFT_1372886 [Fomes fomentarius]|nr:hypothetical protein C8Q74DRAFT_1372886 [Fomes fomentarius]